MKLYLAYGYDSGGFEWAEVLAAETIEQAEALIRKHQCDDFHDEDPSYIVPLALPEVDAQAGVIGGTDRVRIAGENYDDEDDEDEGD